MDIGGLAGPAAILAGAESSKLLAQIDAMQASLAALMAGKGGQPSNSNGGKGFWGQRGAQQPKGGKGKGKGKGADMRPGTRVCHQFSETGRCPHQEKFWWCKFKHVRNVPKTLSSVEGLRFEDLGEVTCNPREDVYTCVACDRDDKAIVPQIQSEVEEINKELNELDDFSYTDASFFARP